MRNFDKLVTAIDFLAGRSYSFAMFKRMVPVLLSVTSLFAFGCGAESGSSRPVDPSNVATESADTSTSARATEEDESEVAAEAAPRKTAEAPATEEKATTEESAPRATKSEIPDANVSIGRMEADGLVTKDIECKSEGGGMALLGMVLVTAWMSPQKNALDGCGPAGSETRVIWKAHGGKVTEISAKQNGKTNACVERALRSGKPMFDGHCAATVEYGKR